jgi:hypothetical protein
VSNLIQIKRSPTTASPSSLNPGELAYSNTSQVLYIGSTDGASVVPIAGSRNPGILTANQALVANSTSGINQVIAANLVTQYLSANGSYGTAGYFLASGGSSSNLYWVSSGSVGVNTASQYTWTNTQTFSANITFNAYLFGNNVNATSYTTGSGFGTSTGGAVVNTTTISVGNSISNSVIAWNSSDNSIAELAANSNNFVESVVWNANSGTSASADFIVNDNGGTSPTNQNFIDMGINSSGWSNTQWTINGPSDGYLYTGNTNLAIGTANANYLSFFSNGTLSTNERMRITPGGNVGIGTTSPAYLLDVNGDIHSVGNTYSNNGLFVNTVNAATLSTGANFTANSSLVNAAAINVVGRANVASLYASTSANVGTVVVANLSGVYTSGSVNAATLSVGTAFIANSTNVVFTGTSISATSANATLQNLTVSGNLVVSGTVVSVNTTQLIVNSHLIELSDNNLTLDTVDSGFFAPAGNGTSIWYSGIARIAALSANNNAVFKIFASNTNPNTAATIDTTSNTSTGSLISYLIPYGTGGAFVANSTVVNITANGTVSSTIVANSITLSTALSAIYGGTGVSTYSAGDILYSGSTNPTSLSKLSIPGSSANGQVLQIVNNLPAYGTLDGGSF